MNTFIEYETNEINNIKVLFNDLCINLEKIGNLNKTSKLNIVDKFRILNKEIYNLENLINEILSDIYSNNSNIDNNLKYRLIEHNKNTKIINNLSPLILYYQMMQN